ncbi:hypothetical protein CDD82_5724 [Ophiocordyceps australis]|uniref:USP domain-containing protein n=1 Tax=Ophiocordyceps australis TaxID=1399860 RepID=A0A2C5YW22_9HYPO|nr:hypothetical protein CDD82_5724 [Ophiocordyceps australis]
MTQVHGDQSRSQDSPSTPPLPHIEDLLALPSDVDGNQSIKRLLEEADAALRRAEISMALNRPAEALRDFVRASVIAIQFVVDHREFSSLRTLELTGTRRMHDDMLKRIHKHSDAFDAIKRHIMADNKRSGVRSSAPKPRPPLSPAKEKPAVQPKPASLHGNVLVPGQKAVASDRGDLASRLANLKGPQPSPGQDVRIKSYLIPAADSTVANKGGAEGMLPVLLPQQPPRTYARSGGYPAVVMPGITAPRKPVGSAPVGAPVAANMAAQGPPTDSLICHVTHMHGWMASGQDILLIDLRPRLAFENGHFDWPDIICIEPTVILRDDFVSAQEIHTSLVLGPPSDQARYAKRHDYERIIIYDQDTRPGHGRPRNTDECAIHKLLRALNLSAPTDNKPKMHVLNGGINAWMEQYGQTRLVPTPVHQRLQRSCSTSAPIHNVRKLPDSEMKSWRKALGEQGAPAAFPRTGAQYLQAAASARRMQSMTDQPSLMPMPPPPVVPRPAIASDCAGGLAATVATMTPSRDILRTGMINLKNRCFINALLQALLGAPGFSSDLINSTWRNTYSKVPRRPADAMDEPQLAMRILANFMYWMNTRIFDKMEALTFMVSGAIEAPFQPFSKLATNHDQRYCKQVSKYNGLEDLGGDLQQDARDFYRFVIGAMHGETNKKRNVDAVDPPQWNPSTSPMAYYTQETEHYRRENDSFTDKYLHSSTLRIISCLEHGCSAKDVQLRHGPSVDILCFVETKALNESSDTLANHLNKLFRESRDQEKCYTCTKPQAHLKFETFFCQLPPILCVAIERGVLGESIKGENEVTWDLDSFDFGPWCLSSAHGARPGRKAVYRTFAVVSHYGTRSEGHYISFVREKHKPPGPKESDWVECNDAAIRRLQKWEVPAKIWRDKTQSSRPLLPYLIFMELIDGTAEPEELK